MLVRIAEAAEELRIHPQTLRRWEREGRIPKARRNGITGQRLYTLTELERLRRLVHGEHLTT